MKQYYILSLIMIALNLMLPSPCSADPSSSFDKNIKFVCSGEKCRGLDFSFRYPSTWKVLDGDRPHVACKVFSENGKGLEGLVVTIFDESKIVNSYLRDIAYANMSKNSTPISYKDNLIIDGCNASSLYFENEGKSLDMMIYSKNIVFVVKSDKHILCFNFTVSDLSTKKNQISKKYEEFLPLFKKMVLSFTILSK